MTYLLFSTNRTRLYLSYLLAAVLLGFQSCGSGTTEDLSLATNQSVTLAISSTVPGDLPLGASEEDLARFAWNEFFALNWQASWSTDNNRGTPNTSWVFSTSGAQPDLAVWETYVHRAELVPDKAPLGDRSKGKPVYYFSNSIDTTTNGITLSNYWNNLDEDNEINSCYLFAYDSVEVMYQAKVNIPEFQYIQPLLDSIAPFKQRIGQYVGDDAKTVAALIPTTTTAFCESDTLVCLPCGQSADDGGYQEGAIEIKTAWRQLLPSKGDDVSRFMTKEVVYYTGPEDALVANTATFGLIGLHIIHKTRNYPSFIFASFEQVDVRDADMKTIGLDNAAIDPHALTPVIDRAIPSGVQSVNSDAKTLITSQNSQSVWQYYQLIGVQGTPVDYADKDSDDNYFMANYVIESDSLLTFFHGKVPDPFDASVQNVVFNGKSVNMGGCQGCHGRAQFLGQDFSFLFNNTVGTPFTADPYQTLAEAEAKAGITGGMAKAEQEKLKRFLAEKD